MWMSDVDRNVWIRGRSLSRIASHARSMSAALARARPQITGPLTSRAIVWTASKSPGEAIGKPASMMSTPSRASCWAISSFSAVLSEMPGDCSPSRKVVSNSRTRFGSSGIEDMSFFSVLRWLGSLLQDWFAASGGRHAQLIPLAGEEKKKSKVERAERHAIGQEPSSDGLDGLFRETVRAIGGPGGWLTPHDSAADPGWIGKGSGGVRRRPGRRAAAPDPWNNPSSAPSPDAPALLASAAEAAEDAADHLTGARRRLVDGRADVADGVGDRRGDGLQGAARGARDVVDRATGRLRGAFDGLGGGIGER